MRLTSGLSGFPITGSKTWGHFRTFFPFYNYTVPFLNAKMPKIFETWMFLVLESLRNSPCDPLQFLPVCTSGELYVLPLNIETDTTMLMKYSWQGVGPAALLYLQGLHDIALILRKARWSLLGDNQLSCPLPESSTFHLHNPSNDNRNDLERCPCWKASGS